jgi:tetratricopeptide (TPR) repeat protein
MARSEHTLEELLREADKLIRAARKKRKEADDLTRHAEDAEQSSGPGKALDARSAVERALAEAEADLSAAVRVLEPELRDREANLVTASPSMAASEDRKELALRLADCYGPLGGIARRARDYRRALEFYGKGRELEMNAAYEIKSTYNRVQWIVMQILVDPSSLSRPDGEVIERASGMLELLSENIVQDAWTSADVILLSAILGDRRRLRRAWDTLVETNPTEDVYKSGLLVLHNLAKRLPDNELLRDAIDLYKSKLPGK